LTQRHHHPLSCCHSLPLSVLFPIWSADTMQTFIWSATKRLSLLFTSLATTNTKQILHAYDLDLSSLSNTSYINNDYDFRFGLSFLWFSFRTLNILNSH
jgi:hypothetical protein